MSRRVVVGNRRRGGAWWRLPLVLTTWSLLVVPVVGVAIAWTTLRRWARELPAVPDLEAFQRQLAGAGAGTAQAGDPRDAVAQRGAGGLRFRGSGPARRRGAVRVRTG